MMNRTFARRIGKRLGKNSKELLENALPKHRYSADLLLNSPYIPQTLKYQSYTQKFLEIGFGMGEHLFHQVDSNPDKLYIGAEVYLNGVAKFLQAALSKGLENFLLWPDDLDTLLPELPDKCLDGIYILFPDPWHKRRYLKKRLVCAERLELLKLKLKTDGFIAFASDIEDYFNDVKGLFTNDPDFVIQNSKSNPDFLKPHEKYIMTKYHQKAIKENRIARFIQVNLH